MSWHSSAMLYRLPITIDNTAGGPGAFDAAMPLASDIDHFWSTVQSDGDDVRITQADGVTAVTKYELASFNATTRVCTLEIQDTAAGAGSLCYWLYWGDSSLSSGQTPFVPASAKSAYIDLGVPVAGYAMRAPAQERLESTDALNQFAKTSDSTIFVWVDFGSLLQRREYPHAGTVELECLSRVQVTHAAGLTATSTATRFEGGSPGAAVVRVQLSGGTTANDYLVTVTAQTSTGRILTAKFVVVCRDIAT